MNGIVSLFWPLLLHMFVSEMTAAFLGGSMDTAAVTAVASIIIIPVACWMYRRDSHPTVQCRRNPFLFAVLCFLGGGLLNAVWSTVLNWIQIRQIFSNQAQEALLAGEWLVQLIGLCVLVPIAEELVFRGLIYQRMKRFLSVRQAILFSSLLFAVYHGNPVQMIFAFPMAAALAAVLEYGAWIGYPILFHMGSNLAAVAVNLIGTGI